MRGSSREWARHILQRGRRTSRRSATRRLLWWRYAVPRDMSLRGSSKRYSDLGGGPQPWPTYTSDVPARHIVVSGLIGAGKSTLVSGLARELGAEARRENVSHNPYFSRFYRDPERWAFHSFVAFAEESLAGYVAAAQDESAIVQERVLEEHLWVFGAEFRERGFLSDEDFRLLECLIGSLLRLLRTPDVVLMLEVSPTAALARLRKRDHPSERGVDLDYLTSLARRYSQVGATVGAPLVRIDGEVRDFRDPGEVRRLADELRERRYI